MRCLQEPLVHVNRSIEDDRELCRRANADRDPEIEFRLELNKEVRAKDASDCHAGLQVVRDRISSIEGSCAVINTRFQERDRFYQQGHSSATTMSFDCLLPTWNRNSTMETVETRCKDELHSLRKVVEVKNQEASYKLNFVFWELKRELRSYFCWHADETGSRCACLRTEFTSTVDKKERPLRTVINHSQEDTHEGNETSGRDRRATGVNLSFSRLLGAQSDALLQR